VAISSRKCTALGQSAHSHAHVNFEKPTQNPHPFFQIKFFFNEGHIGRKGVYLCSKPITDLCKSQPQRWAARIGLGNVRAMLRYTLPA
jgi:hypothetical protein